MGLLVAGDDALCNLHATFEGLCYCDLRLPLLVRPRRREGGRERGREGGRNDRMEGGGMTEGGRRKKRI